MRSLDEPLAPEARAALRVWADALEAAGDPRGPLIAMEHAVRDQPARRHELHRAINEHLVANAPHLLGELAQHLRMKRAVSLDWRSGLLYGASLDTRYLASTTGQAPERFVAMLLGAPAARTLRQLRVRVRSVARIPAVIRALGGIEQAVPLEEILIRPDMRVTWIDPAGQAPWAAPQLAGRYPNLRLLAVRDQLSARPGNVWRPGAALDRALAAIDLTDAAGRIALSRALVCRDAEVRAQGVRRLTELGTRGFLLVETLMLLLAPGIVAPQAPIVACLPTLGDHARMALPLLATITGRPGHYDRDTRSAAGIAIAALRA